MIGPSPLTPLPEAWKSTRHRTDAYRPRYARELPLFRSARLVRFNVRLRWDAGQARLGLDDLVSRGRTHARCPRQVMRVQGPRSPARLGGDSTLLAHVDHGVRVSQHGVSSDGQACPQATTYVHIRDHAREVDRP